MDDSGEHQYDVIVYGFWDANNSMDLSLAARAATEAFIQRGHGVLFGHDTIYAFNPNFTALGEKYLNMKVVAPFRAQKIQSNQIRAIQNGPLTRYPFSISDVVLNIPLSHTAGQAPLTPEDVWIKYETSESAALDYNGKTYDLNSYLTVRGNTALIQSGHSSGATSEDERKIIANTIFHLAQLTARGDMEDTAPDYVPPTQPVLEGYEAAQRKLTFSAADRGDSVVYRVVARESSDSTPDAEGLAAALESADSYQNCTFSNPVSVDVQAGLWGFVYVIDTNAATAPTRSGTFLAPSISGETCYADLAIPSYTTSDMTLHIAAIDKNQNVGEPLHLALSQFMSKVTVRYIDQADGSQIRQPDTLLMHPGERYEATPAHIKNYEFVFAEPEIHTVSVVDNDNAINLYYGKILTKTIVGVGLDEQSREEAFTLFQKDVEAVQGVGISDVQLPSYPEWRLHSYALGSLQTPWRQISRTIVDIPFQSDAPLYFIYEPSDPPANSWYLTVRHLSIDPEDEANPLLKTVQYTEIPLGEAVAIESLGTENYVLQHMESESPYLNGSSFLPDVSGDYIVNVYYNKRSLFDLHYVDWQTKKTTNRKQIYALQNTELKETFIEGGGFDRSTNEWFRVYADKTDVTGKVEQVLATGLERFVPVDDYYTLYVLYRPKTYTLNVLLKDVDTGSEFDRFSYTDVPITEKTFIADPLPANYTYLSAKVPAQLTADRVEHTVLPNDNGEQKIYTVILYYRHTAAAEPSEILENEGQEKNQQAPIAKDNPQMGR